jgi:hypothetical protein
MTRRDLAIRAGGVAAIGAGGGACLWLRALMAAPPHDPTLLEFALVLASFVLSLGGFMALLDGARLVEDHPVRREPGRHRLPPRNASLTEDRDRIQAILARRSARKRRG